ncbi:hypothetical protein SODALDRAFT_381838 [Sodiomyces alkalinus F11]|uniref:Uncharacterized protein n=1 Tax=Sodiomyces alkalinus (strain CBS 110278 / VKM F-3762 / F11) TaxID=1314773 RepID=A0A3N2PKA9_SODAK|nr:hypothetical protein SODALDRAFT_381838 [Sodiomyces alkalinus F11]ROT34860.1 hypothetical protein SODALDRAFT_381838 [Sodiomyces alkalinus F11]
MSSFGFAVVQEADCDVIFCSYVQRSVHHILEILGKRRTPFEVGSKIIWEPFDWERISYSGSIFGVDGFDDTPQLPPHSAELLSFWGAYRGIAGRMNPSNLMPRDENKENTNNKVDVAGSLQRGMRLIGFDSVNSAAYSCCSPNKVRKEKAVGRALGVWVVAPHQGCCQGHDSDKAKAGAIHYVTASRDRDGKRNPGLFHYQMEESRVVLPGHPPCIGRSTLRFKHENSSSLGTSVILFTTTSVPPRFSRCHATVFENHPISS